MQRIEKELRLDITELKKKLNTKMRVQNEVDKPKLHIVLKKAA